MALPTRPMVGLPSSPSFRYKALNPAYQSDPRRILGQSLMTQGSSSAPVRTPLQGLGRLSSALVGAYLQKGAIDRQVAREGAYDDKLTNAMKNIDIGSLPPGMKAAFDINKEFGLNQYLNFEQQKQLNELNKPPAKPVELVTVHNATNYNEVKSFPKGSAELIAATKNGDFIEGNAPTAPAGYKWNNENSLVVLPSGSIAYDRIKEYAKPITEKMSKYSVAKGALRKAATLVAEGDGASDTALIYTFFQALEPGGRVTEGEARMTNSAADYSDQMSIKLKQAFESGIFTQDTRNELLGVMRNVVVDQQKQIETVFNQDSFKAAFKKSGIKVEEFFPTFDNTFSEIPKYGLSLKKKPIKGNILGNIGTGNQISTVIKNSKTNDLINSLTKN